MKKLFTWAIGLFKHKIIRYLFTGGVLFVIDFIIFYILRDIIGVEIKISQFISRGVGAAIGFAGHKFFVFKNDQNSAWDFSRQGILYIILVFVNVFLSGFLIEFIQNIMIDYLSFDNVIVLKVANEIIMVIWTYFVLNIIFKKWKEENNEEKKKED